jgi:hypothetical protein
MDLVAEMLLGQLRGQRFAASLDVQMLRPSLTPRGRRIGRYINRFWDYPRWLRGRTATSDVFHVIDHSYAHLARELPPIEAAPARVVKVEGPRQWLAFPASESAAALVARVAAEYPLVDLSVREPDIEAVIAKMYAGEAEKAVS